MNTLTLFFVIIFLSLISYWLGIHRSVRVAGGVAQTKKLTSLPRQFGLLTVLACGLPATLMLIIWSSLQGGVIEQLMVSELPQSVQSMAPEELELFLNDIQILAQQSSQELLPMVDSDPKFRAALHLQQLIGYAGWLKTFLIIILSAASVAFLLSRFHLKYKAHSKIESIVKWLLLASSAVAVLTTLGIILSVLFESIQFFKSVTPWQFIFGTDWSPQTALRVDQVGSSGSFGAVPLFAGTLLITAIAMLLAVPVGLMIAIFLSQYASSRLRSVAKPMLEVLAGIPTVVYGFFAALTVAPFIRDLGEWFGLSVASESALAAGIVMGVMIIPFVSSLSDDAISAVPASLKEGSLGMGATPSETIRQVLLPAALPGIVGAILLAVSRAIGETMIVVMAAGMAANLTVNPLESVTTVTVQIVTLLTGDQEFDSPKTLAAFALGLMLFITTLALNIVALKVVRKYREQYD